MKYMFFYNSNNSTFGYDFQEFAESLGAKKCYGRYKGTGHGSYFYLVPSEEVYNTIKNAAKEKYNVEVQRLLDFKEDDYPNIKIITEDLNDDFANEFKLYEDLWKDLNEEFEDFGEITNDFTWTMPDGEKVDVSSQEARQAEVERYTELMFDKISTSLFNSKVFMQSIEAQNRIPEVEIEKYFKDYFANKVSNLLEQINSCLESIAKIEADCLEENKRILDKLRAYTSLGYDPGLSRIIGRMNKKEVADKTADIRSELGSLNIELRRCYNKSDK